MTRGRSRVWVALLAATVAVSGCASWIGTSEGPPLPGERIPVLAVDDTLAPDPRIQDLAVRLPPPFANDDWPQTGGVASHAVHHLAAGDNLQEIWRVSIGRGGDSESVLLTQPVIRNGRIFTMDTALNVRAFEAATGAPIWSVSLNPKNEENVLPGGLALGDDRLFATTGAGEVVSLDPASGEVGWRRKLPAPIHAPPTVRGGRVFAVTLANELFALDDETGTVAWSYVGLTEVAGLIGGAAPAASDGTVVAPFSSGELIALRAENGRVLWTETLTALRRTDPVSALPHIRGEPVIDRGKVYAVSHSGRTVAVDMRTGGRIWEQAVGGAQEPWIAGDFLYVLSSEAELTCLSARDGRVRWVRPLQRFEDATDKENVIAWVGPVLVSDRLLVANSLGRIEAVSPYTGAVLGSVEVNSGIALPPSVAGGIVYFLTDRGELIAFK